MKSTITLFSLYIFAIALIPLKAAAATDQELFASLATGKSVAIMRHAIAPGGGDPSEFVIGDCSTQRNLSEQGREQAKYIGGLFRANAVSSADVYSSQWCRCIDTATALGFNGFEPLPILNSFFQDRSTAAQQTTDLKNWIEARLGNNNASSMSPAILVTHQVNITGLTNVFPRSGEIVFVGMEDGMLVPLGRIASE